MKLVSQIEAWARRPYDPKRNSLHRDIFAAARYFVEGGWSKEDAYRLMREAADEVQERHVPDRELLSAIDTAESYESGARAPSVRWPKLQEPYMAEVIAKHRGTADQLVDAAKAEAPRPAADVLRAIYRDDDLVCLGVTAYSFATGTLAEVCEYLTTETAEYINPSPMSALVGTTKDGKASSHCESNTGPKVFQVIEFDFGDPRNHVAIHLHLAQQLPLMMLVYSGGKSVHGWYRLRDESEAAPFFYEATSLGADPKMWSKCQFSRMPAGKNQKTGRNHKVLYFDKRLTRNVK